MATLNYRKTERRTNAFTDEKYYGLIKEAKEYMVTTLKNSKSLRDYFENKAGRPYDYDEILRQYIELVEDTVYLTSEFNYIANVNDIYIIEVDTRPYKRGSHVGWPDTTGVAGYCRYNEQIVTINTKICTTPKQFKKTLVHELIHMIAYEVHGCTGHKGEWKVIADVFGESRCHDYRMKAKEKSAKWELECPRCNQKWHYTRMKTRYVHRYGNWTANRYCVDCTDTKKRDIAYLLITNKRTKMTSVKINQNHEQVFVSSCFAKETYNKLAKECK